MKEKSVTQRVRAINRWRDEMNPVAHLSMLRARALIDGYLRGEYADLMWTMAAPYSGIEASDPDYLALIERRISPLMTMDWNVKTVDTELAKQEATLAKKQTEYVHTLLDGISNLYAVIEHLELAAFRGFAHGEIITEGDRIKEIALVEPWNIVRDGSAGRWKYNPDARSVGFRGLPDEFLIDPSQWIIREVRRPIGRIALTKYIRMNLSQKDWDAFIEIYGVPGGVVIGPLNVPQGKEAEYEAAAEAVSRGGSGYLPNGSSYVTNDSPRGINPFRDHLRYLQEQLILAGTGGKLTMLAESGSGTLAGNAHSETFEEIAQMEAQRISEIIQRQIISPWLAKAFPNQPELVYWELAFREENDVGQIIDHAVKLGQAGFQMDAEELAEKTGYQLTIKPPATSPFAPPTQAQPAQAQGVIANKTPARDLLTNFAQAADMEPLQEWVTKLDAAPDEATFTALLQELLEVMPELAETLSGGGKLATLLETLLADATARGAANAKMPV